MFAHRIVSFTGPDGVVWTETEPPTGDGGVVIEVMAAGVRTRTCCKPEARTN
jgi:hypothetical protein